MSLSSAPSVRATSRSFGALEAAGVLASMGDGILLVGLLAWSYSAREHATIIGALMGARLLPPLLLRPAAGLLRGRRALPVALTAQLLQGIALLPLLSVRSDNALPLVLQVVLLTAILAAFFQPSRKELLRVLPPVGHPAAEKAFANAGLLTLTVGPTAGTALYSTFGLQGTVVAALVTTLGSLGLLAAVGPSLLARGWRDGQTRIGGDGEMGAESCFLRPRDGAETTQDPGLSTQGRALRTQAPPPRTSGILRPAVALVTAGLPVAQVAFTVWGLFRSPEYVGLILAGQGLGMGMATLAYPSVGRRTAPGTLVPASLGIAASACFAFSLAGDLPAAVLPAVAIGFGLSLPTSGPHTLPGTYSREGLRSPLSAGLDVVTEAAGLLSVLAMGPLVDLLSPRLAMVLVSVILWVLALYAFGGVADEESLPDRV